MLHPLIVISVNETASRAHAYGEPSTFEMALSVISSILRSKSSTRTTRTFAPERESYEMLASELCPVASENWVGQTSSNTKEAFA
jgi:hypothetical protein